jgi:hypothetical protein
MLNCLNVKHVIPRCFFTAHRPFGFDVPDANSQTTPSQVRLIDQPFTITAATKDQPKRSVIFLLLSKDALMNRSDPAKFSRIRVPIDSTRSEEGYYDMCNAP